jgi:hypothetical protein
MTENEVNRKLLAEVEEQLKAKNERLFNIPVEDFLLKVNGVRKHPEDVYRKIEAMPRITLAGKTQVQDLGE